MGIGTNSFTRGPEKRKRSKIKVPTKWACNLEFIYDNLRCVKNPRFVPLQTLLRLSIRLFTTCVKIAFCCLSVRLFTTCVKIAFCCLSIRLFTTCVKIAFYSLPVRLFTTCVKVAFYSLSPDSLRTIVLMR